MRLKPEDFARVMDSIPTKVKVIMQKYPRQMVLAGGFIRDLLIGDSPNDIDIFTNGYLGAAHAETLAKEFSQLAEKPIEKSDCAFNVRDEYFTQFIHLVPFQNEYDCAYNTLLSFDFTMAQASVYFDRADGWDSLVMDGFYNAIENKELVFTFPTISYGGKLSHLSRAFKFVGRGWKIDNDSIAAIIANYTGKPSGDIKKDLDSRYKERQQEPAEQELYANSYVNMSNAEARVLDDFTPSTPVETPNDPWQRWVDAGEAQIASIRGSGSGTFSVPDYIGSTSGRLRYGSWDTETVTNQSSEAPATETNDPR
jgi:hypothetical protein